LRRDLVPATPGSLVKLAGTEEAWSYIDNLDFRDLKAKLAQPEHGEEPWSAAKADQVEILYKQLLKLKRKHQEIPVPPPHDVDRFWHAHILDTVAYHRDCDVIFGHYLHHWPYFGMGGDNGDEKELIDAFENTRRLYREEFDVDIAGGPAL
jgi:hypothetical protein